jgi:uncharacterized protein (DUF1800 family)
VIVQKKATIAVCIVALLGTAGYASFKIASRHKNGVQTNFAAPMAPEKRAAHALDRVTFGARPGDLEGVTRAGVDAWIESQLHPEDIDDAALDARLTPLRTLAMTASEITKSFPTKLIVRSVARSRRPLPSDPYERAVYQVQVARYQDKYQRRREAADAGAAPEKPSYAEENPLDDDLPLESRREADPRAVAKAREIAGLSPDRRLSAILDLGVDQQRSLGDLDDRDREGLVDGMPPRDRETFLALGDVTAVPVDELVQAKILRAVYSRRQLAEVMVDFWFNHFNVYIGKGSDVYQTTVYEREAIRPYALGKFEDLLVATARSPAMLVYLDNWESTGPKSELGIDVPPNSPRRYYHRRRRDLNENYGRELLELHTLGVDGGYTQRDVRELARIFTGWTVNLPTDDAGFLFDPRMHEPGSKVLLGREIRESGEKEGLEALHLLAHHPSTAKFISTKLAMRFVSDDPPASMVDRMVETFWRKDGDIREVLRTMFRAPEFWSERAYRSKLKTPLEFVASALRAVDASVQDAKPLGRLLGRMGMPLYGMPAPTGYSMKATAWVNSAALLERFNFALALAHGQVRGCRSSPAGLLGGSTPTDARTVLAVLEHSILKGDVSPSTHEAILAQGGGPAPDLESLAELVLESPEFEKR